QLLGCFLPAHGPEPFPAPASHDDGETRIARGSFHGDVRFSFTAFARGMVKAMTRSVKSALRPCAAISLTMALPTTTASAFSATVRACSGVDMPNPTATGRLVCARILAVICPMVSETDACIPVTPSRDT